MNIFKTVLLLLSIIFLTSCSSSIYIIEPPNTSGFEKAKEIKISAGLSRQEYAISGHINYAYSLNDKYAVMGSGGFLSNNNYVNFTDGFYANIGIGYYKVIREKMVFESYLGYGYGSLVKSPVEKENTSGTIEQVENHKIFNQSSITFKSNDKLLEVILSLKTSNVYMIFNNADVNYIKYKPLIDNPNSILLEPSFAARVGFDDLKIELFFTKLIDLNQKRGRYFPASNIGLGLVYYLKPNKTEKTID